MQFRLAKVVPIIMLLALLTSILPACAPAAPAAQATQAPEETTAPEAGEPTIQGGELEVGVLWEEGSTWFDIVKEIGDSMERDFPGTKVIYTFSNTAARPALEARILAGDPLDVDTLFDSMDPSTHSWVDNGYLMDITDAMNEVREDGTTWKDDFLPIFLTGATYNDKIWGAPEQVYIVLIHYNQKMFDEWGLTPPTTWEEFLETCETIKANGVAPIAVTGQVDYYVGMWWNYLTQRIVGTETVMEYLFGDTDMKLADEPGFLQAAQEMNKLVENGYLMDGWQGTDFTTTQVFFFQDRAAMILMGSWLMTEMKDSIPEGYQLSVAPFPSVEGGNGDQKALFGAARPWTVSAQSDVPELATEYLRRFTADEVSARRAEELGAVSPNAGVPAPPGIGGIDEVMQEAANANFIYYHYGTVGAPHGVQAAWYTPIVEMWLGQLTPEEAIAKIDSNFAAVREQRETAAE